MFLRSPKRKHLGVAEHRSLMLKRLVIFISLIVILSGLSFAQDIKQPAVAGAFYPASALKLSRQIAGYLNKVRPPEIDGRIDVLISPHAGYVDSGAVAAYGYKAIQDKKYKSVIIIGPSHFADFDGISVYPKGVWRTPLGDAGIDSELSAALIKSNPKIYFYPAAFGREHSLEVQLPFLQRVLKDFKIVPIALRRLSYEDCQVLSRALADAVGQRDDVLLQFTGVPGCRTCFGTAPSYCGRDARRPSEHCFSNSSLEHADPIRLGHHVGVGAGLGGLDVLHGSSL